jgi:hypothetical protein
VEVEELAPGLWRWTSGDEPAGLYVETAGGVWLIDPLVPPEERDRFLRALDRDVERIGGTLVVLLTEPSRPRSADELLVRYDGRLSEPGESLPEEVRRALETHSDL